MNLYGYVRNDPVSNVDPDGHDCTAQNTVTNPSTKTCSNSQSDAKSGEQSAARKLLSYLYFKKGNGNGGGVKFKFGPGKLELQMKNGQETKFTTSGKETSSVRHNGASFEVGGFKVGLARETTQVVKENGTPVNRPEKTETVLGFEKGKFEGSNAEIGVGIGGCFVLCGELQVGVQGDKVLHDIKNVDPKQVLPQGPIPGLVL